eukprot:EG_transcript_7624
MLSLDETAQIVSLLQSDKSLQTIQDQFHKAFKPEVYSRLSLSLRCLLDDNYYNVNFDRTKSACGTYQSELLITYFLLYILSTANPYRREDDTLIHLPNTRSVLYEQLQKLETFIRERRHKKELHKDKKKTEKDWEDDEAVRVKTVLKFFILQCITGKMKDTALKKTPTEILRADMQFLESEFDKLGREPQSLRDKLKELQTAFEDERKNAFGGFLGKGISATFAVANEQYACVEPSEDARPEVHELSPLRFEPVFDRPRPPALAMFENELTFLYTDGYFTDLSLDSQISSAQAMELRELMLKAFKSRLNVDQSNQVLALLKSDERLLYHAGLAPTPERLQPLVDNNPNIAEHCLAHLVTTPHATEYLNALICLPLSLHSMELVNKLTSCNLPPRILHQYISNIIHSTRTATDKQLQTRHVRLVCVFLQSLIRNKTMSEHDLFHDSRVGVETQEFALEFSKIKEAGNLYRLLRQVDPNSGTPGDHTFDSSLGMDDLGSVTDK